MFGTNFLPSMIFSARSVRWNAKIFPRKSYERSFLKKKARLETDPANFYIRKFKEFQPGDWKPAKREEIDKKIAKLAEFCDLWDAYEVEMARDKAFDFDDQINWVVRELAINTNLRLDIQERYQWLLIDEYQDTNDAQNQILWHLTEGIENPNIFVVGDDDQSIYRFQGASIANIRNFRGNFPQHLEITLEQNYRSHQHILDAAYGSVAKNLERANADKRLTAANPRFLSPLDTGAGGVITQAAFGSRYSEINWIVEKIREKISTGTKPGEIAILVRKNREIAELARELPKFDIPVSAQISHNIFENEAVRILTLMLEVFTDEKYDEKLFDLLHSEFLGIAPADLLQLSLQRRAQKVSMIELLNPLIPLSGAVGNSTKNNDPALFLKGRPGFDFFEFFIASRQQFWHLRPPVLAEKLLYESGLAEWLTEKNKTEDWHNIRKFIDWIREQNADKTAEILTRIGLHQELNIPIRPDALPADKQAVQVMTAHKSKGQEFEIVFIPGLEDKKWGNTFNRSFVPLPKLESSRGKKEVGPVATSDENEEERRLFFVALTRAKAELFLSHSQTDFSGRAKNPSQFWHEIPEALITDESSDETENEVQKLLPIFLQHQEKTLTDGEKEILKKSAENFVWSASSLQNYLDCPRRFLYQNLYKFPRRPQPQLSLGVALHQALELFFKSSSLDKGGLGDFSAEFLVQQYEYALSGQNLPKDDYQKWLEHGTEILKHYYEQKLVHFSAENSFGYQFEYNFKNHTPQVNGIPITGVVDKVEFLDAEKKLVKITDYKSGKPRAIVAGERLWRQLVFYDLLAKNSRGISWEVASCELDFLTPDAKNKLQTKSLEVSAVDRDQVIAELSAANAQLENLEFPVIPNPTRDPDIEFWNNFGQ